MNERFKQLAAAHRWIAVLAMFSLLLGGVSLLGEFPVHAHTQGVATPALLTWKVVSSPNVGTSYNFLRGVAVVSANDVWAVGTYCPSTIDCETSPASSGSSSPTAADVPNRTLIEHWNGSAWRRISSPNVGTNESILKDVAVVSANDVWAVGYYYTNTFSTLIEHWNGSAWSIVSSPNVGKTYTILEDVAVVSANDVWAVGTYDSSSTGKSQTLIEHWNGSAWSVVSSPNVEKTYNYLSGVAKVSASDVWAVGTYHSYSTRSERTLIEHWNGSAWSIVSSPNGGVVTATQNHLEDVAAVSASNVWAVGHYASHSLIEHWNGSAWSVVSSPSLISALYSIAAVSASNVWAVGLIGGTSGGTLIEHWNGSVWSVVSSPNVGEGDSLYGVAKVSASDIWAVGDYLKEVSPSTFVYQTLIEHYSSV